MEQVILHAENLLGALVAFGEECDHALGDEARAARKRMQSCSGLALSRKAARMMLPHLVRAVKACKPPRAKK